MKVQHRLVFTMMPDKLQVLKKLALDTDSKLSRLKLIDDATASRPYFRLEIYEHHPKWNELLNYKSLLFWSDSPKTIFTKMELANAKFFNLSAWLWDYPQPADDFDYLNFTYDLSNYSSKSGMIAVQKAPFRMRCEPKWGKKHFLTLNWVFDALFTHPQIYDDFLSSLGIETMPVIHHKKGSELKTVIQLLPQGTVELDMENHPFEICPVTGVKKYPDIRQGYFPGIIGDCDFHLCVSNQHFGDGGCAFKNIIISATLQKYISEKKLKGVWLTPLLS